MKNILSLILLIFTTTSVYAQTFQQLPAVEQVKVDASKQQVTTRLQQWFKALDQVAANPQAIQQFYLPNVTIISPFAAGPQSGASGLKNYLARIARLSNVQVLAGNVAINIYGNTAVCGGQYIIRYTDDIGQPLSIAKQFSLVFVKVAAKWMIVMQHVSSPIPGVAN